MGGNLADQKPAKNPLIANNTINYINKIGADWPVRKAGLGCLAQRFSRSAKARRFQVVVRLDDLNEPLLGGAIPAIGVGMKLLHQFLKAQFHLGRRGADIEPESVERLALGIADLALFRVLFLLGAHALAEQPERIVTGAEGAQIRTHFS